MHHILVGKPDGKRRHGGKILRLSQSTNEFELKMDWLGIGSSGELFVHCNGPFGSKKAENFLTDCETGDHISQARLPIRYFRFYHLQCNLFCCIINSNFSRKGEWVVG